MADVAWKMDAEDRSNQPTMALHLAPFALDEHPIAPLTSCAWHCAPLH